MKLFADFLRENGRVGERERPFYQHWADAYIKQMKRDTIDGASLKEFVTQLETTHEDWQVAKQDTRCSCIAITGSTLVEQRLPLGKSAM